MLILNERKFVEAAFDSEEELERVIVAHSEYLFGPASIYIPSALIRTRGGSGTIPDGFAIDLAGRRWFIVEAELSRHGVWNHIAPQVAKQIIAARNPASRQLLIDLVVEKAQGNESEMGKFADEDIDVINIRQALASILEHDPTVGIPIDAIPGDLREWADTLKVTVNLWIVRKHVEFGDPAQVLYEFPEEFRPELDTGNTQNDGNPSEVGTDVTLADLILGGLLTEGQKLQMSWKPRNGERQTFEGTVRGAEIEVLGKRFSPSYAAVYAMQSAGGDRSTENGWMKWKNENGVLLRDLRESYLLSRGSAND